MKRKTVWVLWKRDWEGSVTHIKYEISSKNSWQKRVEAHEHMNRKRAEAGRTDHPLTYTHLAESADKVILLTMLRMLENQ